MNIDNPYKELAEAQKLLILIHEAALKDCDKETEELEEKVNRLQKQLEAVSTNDAKIVGDLSKKINKLNAYIETVERERAEALDALSQVKQDRRDLAAEVEGYRVRRKALDTPEQIKADRHILVDLDGTLAHYNGWKGADHIGEPIPAMVDRVKQWTAQGTEVRIFTARAYYPERIAGIKAWLVKHGLGDLEVTCVKLPSAVEIWDDLAVQVVKNTGKVTVQETQDVYVMRLAYLQNTVAEQAQKILDYKKAIDSMRAHYQTRISTLEAEVEDLHDRDDAKEIARLKSLVAEKEGECKYLFERNQRLDKDLRLAEGKHDSANTEAYKAEKRHEEKLADMRVRLKELEDYALSIGADKKRLAEELERANNERDKLKATLAYEYVQKMIVERDAARRECDNLKALWAQAHSNGRALNGSDSASDMTK